MASCVPLSTTTSWTAVPFAWMAVIRSSQPRASSSEDQRAYGRRAVTCSSELTSSSAGRSASVTGRTTRRSVSMRSGAVRAQAQRHEDAVRVVGVAGERPAVREAEALVQLARRQERRHRAGFQPEPAIAARAGDLDDVRQQGPARPLAPTRLRRAHRLHLAVLGVDLLERAAAQQAAVAPGRPEGDVGAAQLVEIERVHALGRREPVHVLQVLVEQRVHLGPGEVVDLELH